MSANKIKKTEGTLEKNGYTFKTEAVEQFWNGKTTTQTFRIIRTKEDIEAIQEELEEHFDGWYNEDTFTYNDFIDGFERHCDLDFGTEGDSFVIKELKKRIKKLKAEAL